MATRHGQQYQDSYADMMAAGGTQKHMIMEASIQGINDAYLVIVGISIVGLLLSLFIKQVGQRNPENRLKRIVKRS